MQSLVFNFPCHGYFVDVELVIQLPLSWIFIDVELGIQLPLSWILCIHIQLVIQLP